MSGFLIRVRDSLQIHDNPTQNECEAEDEFGFHGL